MARTCGSCSACCRWPSIEELNKPAKTACPNLEKCGHGCTIYEVRPQQCSDYQCSWLRGVGEERDRPDISKILIDRRNTQFGQAMMVAKMLHPNAEKTRKGETAIRNASKTGPVLIVDYDDPNRVIGAAGPKELQKEIASKEVKGVIRIGGQQDWIQNILAHAEQGKVYPGLPNGW